MAKVGFIVGEMFEDDELRVPLDRIGEAGHEVIVIGVEAGKELKGDKGREKITADAAVDDIDAEDLDALVIPGGYSPDHLRTNEAMVDLVREIDEEGKPLAAVCHAGSMLIEADIVDGRRLTSWPSIRTDLINAGADWVDEKVVEDGNLITSRNPGDLDAFCDAILRQLEGSEEVVEEIEEEQAEREKGIEAGEPSR